VSTLPITFMAQYGREQMQLQTKDISLTVGGQVHTLIVNGT